MVVQAYDINKDSVDFYTLNCHQDEFSFVKIPNPLGFKKAFFNADFEIIALNPAA